MAISINAVQEYELSSDKSEVTIHLQGRYVDRHSIKMSVTCVDELIQVLNRIKQAAGDQKQTGQIDTLTSRVAEQKGTAGSEDSMLTAQINAIKEHRLSADKGELALILDAKHVGDLSVVLMTAQIEQLSAIIAQAKAELPIPAAAKDELKVTVPKTWLVAGDVKLHNLVLIVFNMKTAAQTAYGMEPKAAKKLADALAKKADAVLSKTPGALIQNSSDAKH